MVNGADGGKGGVGEKTRSCAEPGDMSRSISESSLMSESSESSDQRISASSSSKSTLRDGEKDVVNGGRIGGGMGSGSGVSELEVMSMSLSTLFSGGALELELGNVAMPIF
jgi:hypothetical protein